MKNVTQSHWLNNRSEMIIFINDELDLYNDKASAQKLYKMTDEELKAICLEHIDSN